MIKKILVPLAFSPYAEGILRYAAALAKAFAAQLVVVNIINQRDLEAVRKITAFGYKVDTEHYLQTLIQERRDTLAQLLEKVGLDVNTVPFHFEVGDPAEKLLQLVVKEDIDAVVMGVKNRDLRTLFTGSVAERVFQRCPVTVISYRDEEIASDLRKRIVKHKEQ
jgi:nucleotide-binding universal stress UspA family protein